MDQGFRADLVVKDSVLTETKSVASIEAVHKNQVLTYLKLTSLKLDALINFNEEQIKNGFTRIVNNP